MRRTLVKLYINDIIFARKRIKSHKNNLLEGYWMFDFAKELKDYLQREFITDEKDWSIKGFIDAKKKIYPISLDTKLLSKILELTILPLLIDFCKKTN